MGFRGRKMATKRKRGRPPETKMPERIDAPAEKIAEVVLQAKPKETWKYLEAVPETSLPRPD